MTTPCNGDCACPEPCPDCVGAPSLPPFARALPFVAPLREAGTSLTVTEAAPDRAGAEGPATGGATLSTPARREGGR